MFYSCYGVTGELKEINQTYSIGIVPEPRRHTIGRPAPPYITNSLSCHCEKSRRGSRTGTVMYLQRLVRALDVFASCCAHAHPQIEAGALLEIYRLYNRFLETVDT